MPSAFQRKARTLPVASSSSSEPSTPDGPSSSSPASSSRTTITHPTLRPSPFPQQQPLPLFSLGLSAINDILTGVGLPSGCLGIFQPLQSDDYQDDHDDGERTRLEAGAAYSDLVLKYSVAQGIAHGHKTVVIGQGVQSWCKGLMGWTGQDMQTESQYQAESSGSQSNEESKQNEAGDDDDEEEDESLKDTSNSSQNNLKSAFRYDKLQKIRQRQGLDDPRSQANKDSSSSSVPFVHPFDLTLRIKEETVDTAIKSDRLVIREVEYEEEEEGDVNTYERVWKMVEDIVQKHLSDDSKDKDGSSIPIRIILPSIGSPIYTLDQRKSSHARESYRLLMRIKSLIRFLSWPSSKDTPPTPSISLCTLSPLLLLSTPHISSRLTNLCDSSISLSSFSSSPISRSVFSNSNFIGSIKINKTPLIGSLKSTSIRSSILRGMMNSSDNASDGGGGGGTSENLLGFKIKRKVFKIEILGRDLILGNDGDSSKKEEVKAPTVQIKRQIDKQSQGDAQSATLEDATSNSVKATPPLPAAQQQQPPQSPSQPPRVGLQSSQSGSQLKGIAALRARGLQASQNKSISVDNKPISVDDSHSQIHSHSHDSKQEKEARRIENLKQAAKQDW
ncbi:unnamed protein product [Sympodiomycopsis kandeliae]